MFAPVGRIDRARRVHERGQAAHLRREADTAPGRGVDRVDQAADRSQGVVAGRQAGPGHEQRAVVLGEAFGDPQLGRHVGVVEVERLERSRPDALDVPGVEELVRHRAEQRPLGLGEARPARSGPCCCDAPCRRRSRPGRRWRGRCSARARRPAARRRRRAPRARSSRRRRRSGRLRRRCRRGGARRGSSLGVAGRAAASLTADLERPHRLRPELHRAVEQVGEVRRGEDERVVGRVELRGHRPGDVGRRHERQPGGPRLERLRPHQRRRHVEVRLGGVDARVGAVDAIAEQAIAEADGAAVARDAPDVQVRPRRRQRPAGAVAELHARRRSSRTRAARSGRASCDSCGSRADRR